MEIIDSQIVVIYRTSGKDTYTNVTLAVKPNSFNELPSKKLSSILLLDGLVEGLINVVLSEETNPDTPQLLETTIMKLKESYNRGISIVNRNEP